jgi:hypothetical protein
MSRRKPAPDLIRGGDRFADKDMRRCMYLFFHAIAGKWGHFGYPVRRVPKSLETVHERSEYCRGGVVYGDAEMTTRAVKLLAAENDLKLLMADVTRAMEKAQDAVARIAGKAAAEAASAQAGAPAPGGTQARI